MTDKPNDGAPMNADQKYIRDMRDEAGKRRAEAENAAGTERDRLLERAAYFDQCATEREAEVEPAAGRRRPSARA